MDFDVSKSFFYSFISLLAHFDTVIEMSIISIQEWIWVQFAANRKAVFIYESNRRLTFTILTIRRRLQLKSKKTHLQNHGIRKMEKIIVVDVLHYLRYVYIFFHLSFYQK